MILVVTSSQCQLAAPWTTPWILVELVKHPKSNYSNVKLGWAKPIIMPWWTLAVHNQTPTKWYLTLGKAAHPGTWHLACNAARSKSREQTNFLSCTIAHSFSMVYISSTLLSFWCGPNVTGGTLNVCCESFICGCGTLSLAHDHRTAAQGHHH